jgi:hypothetical protein
LNTKKSTAKKAKPAKPANNPNTIAMRRASGKTYSLVTESNRPPKVPLSFLPFSFSTVKVYD